MEETLEGGQGPPRAVAPLEEEGEEEEEEEEEERRRHLWGGVGCET